MGNVKGFVLDAAWIRVGFVIIAVFGAMWTGQKLTAQKVDAIETSVVQHSAEAEKRNATCLTTIEKLETKGCTPSVNNRLQIAVMESRLEVIDLQQQKSLENDQKILDGIREISGK